MFIFSKFLTVHNFHNKKAIVIRRYNKKIIEIIYIKIQNRAELYIYLVMVDKVIWTDHHAEDNERS